MIVKKITTGFVIQDFDTKRKQYLSQEFIAGDEVNYETENEGEGDDWLDDDGNVVDDPSKLMLNEVGNEPYLPFTMMQPVNMDIPDTLVIEVEGGCVTGVENLLTYQNYVLLDRDVDEKITLEQCKEVGTHLLSCDDDGYCNFCEEQDS